MANASLRSVCDFLALNEAVSDEDVSSIIVNPTDICTRATSGGMAAEKNNESKTSKGKEKSSSVSGNPASSRKQ